MDNEFLAEIADNPTDEATRLVYQDWLEEHGDERAEYLRLQSELAQFDSKDQKREKVRRKLRKLQGKLLRSWRDWLLSVSRSKIENCFEQEHRQWESEDAEGKKVTFSFECPKEWARLQPADDSDDATIRYCDQCNRHVFYCDDVDEANDLASWGQCIAVDETLVRKKPTSAGLVVGELAMPIMPQRLQRIREQARPDAQ